MAASTILIDPATHGAVGEVHDEQLNPLGLIGHCPDGSEYIYLAGVAALKQYGAVKFNPASFATALLVADACGPVAIATAAIVANKFGWFMIRGVTPVINKGAININSQLYIGN